MSESNADEATGQGTAPTEAVPLDEQVGFRPPRRVVLGIGIALLLQVAIPLSYYARDDPYDERFAWRMFSGVRLQSCQTRVVETTADGPVVLELYKLIHEAWIGHFRRNRRAVIGAFLEERCRGAGVTAVMLENRCRSATGETAFASQRYGRQCDTGELAWPEPMLLARPESAEAAPADATPTANAPGAGE